MSGSGFKARLKAEGKPPHPPHPPPLVPLARAWSFPTLMEKAAQAPAVCLRRLGKGWAKPHGPSPCPCLFLVLRLQSACATPPQARARGEAGLQRASSGPGSQRAGAFMAHKGPEHLWLTKGRRLGPAAAVCLPPCPRRVVFAAPLKPVFFEEATLSMGDLSRVYSSRRRGSAGMRGGQAAPPGPGRDGTPHVCRQPRIPRRIPASGLRPRGPAWAWT